MDKSDVIAALEEMADLMEIRGENTFRVRSIRNGARAVEAMAGDLAGRVKAGTLEEVAGIGATLAEVITELVGAGRCERLEELRMAVPPAVRELLSIPGLGPKKAHILHEQLGIAGVADLEKACREGKVAALKGFGKRTEEKILEGIAFRRTTAGRFLIVEALAAAEPLIEHLREESAVERVELAGSLRRWRETIKDIDLVAAVDDPGAAPRIMDRFAGWKGVEEVIARGDTKSSVRLRGGIQADLRVVERRSFPYALQYFTGSKEHNTALRGLAREKGLKLNEYGLFRIAGDEEALIECGDEAAIYRALGLDEIPPELRENTGEIESAREKRLPELVRLEDIRGVVHVHTDYSDGRQPLEEMASAAREAGFEYLGVTDHSQSAGYAGGLKEAGIARQHEEIDRLNARYESFRIFKGIESDIRADGSLDYPPAVLDRFDFVVASVHSGFGLPEEEQTARVIRALEDPHTTFLGHPTGRLLLEREGFAINLEKVLEAAGRLGVAVEINANPHRLDLDWRWGRFARECGVKTAIHPDAHAAPGYADIRFGIGIARKAGYSAPEVVSTYSAKAFERFIRARRGG